MRLIKNTKIIWLFYFAEQNKTPFCFYKQEYDFLIMRGYKNQMLFDNARIIKPNLFYFALQNKKAK